VRAVCLPCTTKRPSHEAVLVEASMLRRLKRVSCHSCVRLSNGRQGTRESLRL
jgi:hypothetical protein